MQPMAITIPLRRPADLRRVGMVADLFASALHRTIEVITIVDPQDDLRLEFERFSRAVEDFAAVVGRDVKLRVVADEAPLKGFLDMCLNRFVCMATAASPFDDAHYVGSFAAALLAKTSAPVVLVGPSVPDVSPPPIERVVLGVSNDVDSSVSLELAHTVATGFGCPMAKVRIDTEHGVIYESDSRDPREWFPEEVHATMRAEPIEQDDISAVLVERSAHSILVFSTRAHQGLTWICEGSVAFGAISLTSMPIVAVGPNAVRGDVEQPQPSLGREVTLASPHAEAAIEELDERLRVLKHADGALFTAHGAG